jgi:hypothetical protein
MPSQWPRFLRRVRSEKLATPLSLRSSTCNRNHNLLQYSMTQHARCDTAPTTHNTICHNTAWPSMQYVIHPLQHNTPFVTIQHDPARKMWYTHYNTTNHLSQYRTMWYTSLTLSLPVAIMRLLGSAPKSHLCDQKRRSKVTDLSDLMTLFINLGCLYCKQTQSAFNVFKNTLNWLKFDLVAQKFHWLECGNFSKDAGTPGTERVIVFSQLAVKGLTTSKDQTLPVWWKCN